MNKEKAANYKKIGRKKLYEDIVTQIKQRIANGELKAGDRLPTESEFINEFGVSQVTLREGLRIMESEGLIISRQGGGRFVQAAHPEKLFHVKGVVTPLEKSQVMDLLEARETVECKVAFLAAKRAYPEEIKELRQIFNKITACVKRNKGGDELFKFDSQFHKVLAIASHNKVFLNWINLSLDISNEVRKKTLKMKENPKAIVRELTEIMEAVEKGDARGAAGGMRKHLQATRKRFIQMQKI